MSLIDRWWSHPVGHTWTAAFQRSNPLLRDARRALGTWSFLYAALCVLSTLTPAGVPDGLGRILAYGLAGAGSLIGVLWIRGPWPTENYSRLYVVYLELSTSIALLMLADPFVALPCAAGFAVNGGYIAAFHSPRMIVGHQSLAAAIVVVLYARALAEPGADVAVATAYLVLLILVLFSAPVLTYILLLLLRRDAAEAFFDPLTGLRNRRGLASAITDCGDREGIATVMVIDLDDFKAVNDCFGHAHGDRVLRNTADAIHAVFPAPAITARTGGEEFAVITHLESEEAVAQAYALRTHFASKAGIGVTFSIGVAHADASTFTDTFDHVSTQADAAMYAAKHAGGDTIHIHVVVPTAEVEDVRVDGTAAD